MVMIIMYSRKYLLFKKLKNFLNLKYFQTLDPFF